MLEKRVPPQNIEAEQAVLGAMLIDKEAIIQVSEILTNIDFIVKHIVLFLRQCLNYTISMKPWIWLQLQKS